MDGVDNRTDGTSGTDNRRVFFFFLETKKKKRAKKGCVASLIGMKYLHLFRIAHNIEGSGMSYQKQKHNICYPWRTP